MTGGSRPLSILSLLLFPPRCAVCSDVVAMGQALCPACAGQLTAALGARQCCLSCGKPRQSCLCRGEPLFFSRCLSVFLYTADTRQLFDRLKAGDEGSADQLAAMMARRWRESGLSADAIAFVPAAGERYNQAGALGRRLGALLGIKVLPDPLTRHQNSRVQHTLSFEERRKNAASSYDRNGEPLLSGRILLVDDIITTGATLSRCAQLLLQSGAREVLCLTAATTPLHGGEDREPSR